MFRNSAKSIFNILTSKFGAHKIPTFSPRLWILMYHRVLPISDHRFSYQEPGMVVTPDTFAMNIKIINELFTVMHLKDWINLKNNNMPLPKKACCITFDDGWSDNYEFAYPILKSCDTPATIFLVSSYIGSNKLFWPNLISQFLYNNYNKPEIIINTLEWVKNIDSIVKNSSSFTELQSEIITKLKLHTDEEIYSLINNSNIELSRFDEKPDMLTWDDVNIMRESSLIDFGCHTANHYRLNNSLDDQLIYNEIVSSKKLIELNTGHKVNLFCYPNGNYNDQVLNLTSKHYEAAVTTNRGINSLDTDVHELSRIGIHQDIGNTVVKFKSRISGWYT